MLPDKVSTISLPPSKRFQEVLSHNFHSMYESTRLKATLIDEIISVIYYLFSSQKL